MGLPSKCTHPILFCPILDFFGEINILIVFREDARSDNNTVAPTVTPPVTASEPRNELFALLDQLQIEFPIQQNITVENRNIENLRTATRRRNAREAPLAGNQQSVVDRYLTELPQQLNGRVELPAGEDAMPRREAIASRDRAGVATYREHLERRAEERIEARQAREALAGTPNRQEGVAARRARVHTRILDAVERNQMRPTMATTATAEVGRMNAGIGANPIQRQPSTTLLPPVEQMSTTQLVRRLSTINEPETSQPSRRELEITPWAINVEGVWPTSRERYEAAYQRLDNGGATGEERLVLQMQLQRAIDEMSREERDEWF